MKMYAGVLAFAIVLVLGNAVSAVFGPAVAVSAVEAVPGMVWLNLGAGVLALLAGAGLWSCIVRERQIAWQRESKTRHNDQEAIVRLIEEIGALAKGDLTVHAKPNKDITSEIADVINGTVGTLRERMRALAVALEQMTPHLEQGVAAATRLMEASRQQAQELAAISPGLGQIHSGVDVARETQGQMEDIAQHVTVLALNAEISASPTDHSGHLLEMFAADVQQMGESIGVASRQIDDLQQKLHAQVTTMEGTFDRQRSATIQASNEAQQALQSLDALALATDNLRQWLAGFKMPESLMLRRTAYYAANGAHP